MQGKCDKKHNNLEMVIIINTVVDETRVAVPGKKMILLRIMHLKT